LPGARQLAVAAEERRPGEDLPAVDAEPTAEQAGGVPAVRGVERAAVRRAIATVSMPDRISL
jgi:hypothetical protein